MPTCAFNGCTTDKNWETCTNCGTVILPNEVAHAILGLGKKKP